MGCDEALPFGTDTLDELGSSKGLGFFMSEAPPLSQLNSWDETSEQNAVRKQRGWVMILVKGGVLPCSE